MRRKLKSFFKRSIQADPEISSNDLIQSLNLFVQSIHKRVPTEVFSLVSSIRDSIHQIIPQINDINSSEPYVFSIRRTVESYLPEAVENYLKLPASKARYEVIKNGKTATDLLVEQLQILDNEMKEIVGDLSQNNVQKMLVHGRFLDNRFGKSDWLKIDD
ncbi:MAG: hypothetical protein AAF902_00080 [Chloroflexota bacterium]